MSENLSAEIRLSRWSRPRRLHVNGESHEIVFGETEVWGQGYEGRVFEPADGSTEFNGSQFALHAYTATSPYRITGQAVVREVPQAGEGYFLGVTVEGEVVEQQFEKGKKHTPIEYGLGAVASWIAGPSGLLILSVRTPPFQDSMEEKIDINNPHRKLPEAFIRRYTELTHQGPQ